LLYSLSSDDLGAAQVGADAEASRIDLALGVRGAHGALDLRLTIGGQGDHRRPRAADRCIQCACTAGGGYGLGCTGRELDAVRLMESV